MREFDASLQRLGKLLYTFFAEEKVESHYEREALVRVAAEQLCEGYMIAKSAQAGRETAEAMLKERKSN